MLNNFFSTTSSIMHFLPLLTDTKPRLSAYCSRFRRKKPGTPTPSTCLSFYGKAALMIMETAHFDPEEIAKFEAIAAEWWDPKGRFKPLHQINPLRLDYIADS